MAGPLVAYVQRAEQASQHGQQPGGPGSAVRAAFVDIVHDLCGSQLLPLLRHSTHGALPAGDASALYASVQAAGLAQQRQREQAAMELLLALWEQLDGCDCACGIRAAATPNVAI